MTLPDTQPTNPRITIEGRTLPLLPVYVGQKPRDGQEDGPLVHTWVLWGHPDLEEDIEFPPDTPISIKMDTFPGNSQVVVHQELVVRIPRHAG